MKRTILISLILHLLTQLIYGQDFIPYPGYSTHCPDELKTYTSTGFCAIPTWTIINGKIRKEINGTVEWVTTYTGNEAIIKWDNVAAIGKLKASATCNNTTEVNEKSFSIKSLTGVTPANLRKDVANLYYCEVNSVWILVDPVKLPSTGGTTGITERRWL